MNSNNGNKKIRGKTVYNCTSEESCKEITDSGIFLQFTEIRDGHLRIDVILANAGDNDISQADEHLCGIPHASNTFSDRLQDFVSKNKDKVNAKNSGAPVLADKYIL